jgi:hypothetical protein
VCTLLQLLQLLLERAGIFGLFGLLFAIVGWWTVHTWKALWRRGRSSRERLMYDLGVRGVGFFMGVVIFLVVTWLGLIADSGKLWGPMMIGGAFAAAIFFGFPVALHFGYFLDRIGGLYGIEAEIRGLGPDEWCSVRRAPAGPELESLHAWLHRAATMLPKKSELGLAIRYALSNWTALTRYRDDGPRDRQQRSRASATSSRFGPQELAVRRFRRRRRARRGNLHPFGDRKAQRAQPRVISLLRSRVHRGPSDQPDRGSAALERRREDPITTAGRLIRVWTRRSTSYEKKSDGNSTASSFYWSMSWLLSSPPSFISVMSTCNDSRTGVELPG